MRSEQSIFLYCKHLFMRSDYRQIDWSADVEEDCRELVRLAVREDLDRVYDWTTVALVSAASGTTGDLLMFWTLHTARDAMNGDSIQVNAGALTMTLD